MDEVLEYVTKAAGVRVAESTLANQTIAFMQELTEAVGTLAKVCLVVTLPSSIMEHYDAKAERLYQQLQHVAGRVEKIYTPVQENEITKIIRRRLFSQLDDDSARDAVACFMGYAEKEGILPAGLSQSEYRDRFLDSYPFMPEVVDMLYHHWGSFPSFQRTRGVLRLLSLVVHSLKGSNKPYISAADFDLANQGLRQELVKHLGQEYNSIIAADITNIEAGSKKVDSSLGNAYQGLNLGSRAARTIFLHSFSGGREHGITTAEIKRAATTPENPASVVAEAVEQLRGKLFYLQNTGERYFFSNQPNLNRILLKKMENIKDDRLVETERELLKKSILGGKMKVFIWEKNPGNIPDSEELKLVILNQEASEMMSTIVKTKGQTPRVYRNTIFFLYPLESERTGFINTLKHKMAYDDIEADKSLNLSAEQQKTVKKELDKAGTRLKESIRMLYRIIAIPDKERFKDADLGIPTYGEDKGLDHEVYEKLRADKEILERIAPLVLREKYLSGRDYVSTDQLYQSSLKTPGEPRPKSKAVLEQGISEGVRMGLFGLGEMENDAPVCRYFKEPASIAFSENEVMISEALCNEQRKRKEILPEPKDPVYPQPSGTVNSPPISGYQGNSQGATTLPTPSVSSPGSSISPQISPTASPTASPSVPPKVKDKIHLRFQVPKGKVANIMGVMNLLQSKFAILEMEW
ncbi:MAG: DUF499 domain-containing protein [bacterium]